MKTYIKSILFVAFMAFSMESYAQFGNAGMGRNPYSGRRQSLAPQEPMRQDKPENLTAEQIVDQQLPSLSEALALSVFEEAVVRTILVNAIQKSIELQLLKLDPEKTKEAIEKIRKEQEDALKSGLPEDKFQAFMTLQEEGFKKPKKKKKKEKNKS